MIIFYDKKTKKITGTIDGRVHDKHTLEKGWVGSKKGVEKYVVPLKPKVEKGKIVELIPDGPIADLILKFENNKDNIYTYKVKINKDKKLIGLIKND